MHVGCKALNLQQLSIIFKIKEARFSVASFTNLDTKSYLFLYSLSLQQQSIKRVAVNILNCMVINIDNENS